MIRFVVRTFILLVANAIGLLVASVVLDGMDLDVAAFLVSVAIFTVLLALVTPLLRGQLQKRESPLLGGVALIATLLSLVVTDLISDGFTIDGLTTWVVATLIVWVASLIAAFILPLLGLKKHLAE
jgi:uncharacterized membrane protein YvlD (DUF360 family)